MLLYGKEIIPVFKMNKKGADRLSPSMLVIILLATVLGILFIYYVWSLKVRLAV